MLKGISSLSLKRISGVNYRTTWLVQNKVMQAIRERDEAYVLRVMRQLDNVYLGRKCNGGNPARGSEDRSRPLEWYKIGGS